MDSLWPSGLAILALVVSYGCRRRFYLASIDPLKLQSVKEAVWVYTVFALLFEGAATQAQAAVFGTTIVAWWLSWYLLGRRWGSKYVAATRILWSRAARSSSSLRWTAYWLFAAGALITVAITFQFGGGGDNRLFVAKLLRPIEGFTTILLAYVIFMLMIGRRWFHWLALFIVCLALIYTGGRSALLSLLLPLSILSLIGRVKIRAKTIAWLTVLILAGALASGLFNYGSGSVSGSALLLFDRVLLDGDVYLLSLPGDLVSQTTTTSLLAYVFGPILKLLGEPIKVDLNIGAQLLGLFLDIDTLNGPNPHWPVVLMAYGHYVIAEVFLLTIVATVVCVWLKARMIAPRAARLLPLTIAIPFSSFCAQYPQYFFTDPSFPSIFLIHAVIVAAVWSVIALIFSHARVPNPVGHYSLAPQPPRPQTST